MNLCKVSFPQQPEMSSDSVQLAEFVLFSREWSSVSIVRVDNCT